MSQHDVDAIAAFIRARGVTRCPTACAAPTQAVVSVADRSVPQQRADLCEATWEAAREERIRRAWLRRVGASAA